MTEQVILEEIRLLTEALERCRMLAGLKPKVVAGELEIGLSHYSRMMNVHDSLNFPPDKIDDLMVLCGNVLPLEWLAWRRGYALHEKGLNEVLRAIAAALCGDGKQPVFRLTERGLVERCDVGVQAVREGG